MKIFIGYALAIIAAGIVLGNIYLVYRRSKLGCGPSPLPAFASILGSISAVLLGYTSLILPIIILDFGSWMLAAYIIALVKRLKKRAAEMEQH